MSPEERLDQVQSQEDGKEKWRKLLILYERDLPNITDVRDRAVLLFIMGEIHEFQMEDPETALKFYQQSYQTDPTYIPPIKAAVRLFLEIENYEMVIYLLSMVEKSAVSTDEKVGSLIDRARILLFNLNDPDEAEKLLQRALELDPKNEVVQKLLEQVYLKRGDTEIALSFYERMAQEGSGGMRLDALLRLGAARERDPEKVEDAIAALEEVLKEEPDNAVALAALSRLYTRFGMWEDLVRVLEQVLTQAPEEEIPSLCYRLGRLWRDELKKPQTALGYFRQGLDKEPENLALLYELAATLEQEKDWQALKEAYERLLGALSSDSQKLDVLLKLAALCEDRLNEPDEALKYYQQIIDLKPDYVPVVVRIAKLYARQGQWERLITLTLRECERLTDPKLKAARYFRIAEIYEENLDEPEKAIEYYKKVLEELPGYVPALKALASIFNRLERWHDLIDVIEQEIAITKNRDHLVYLHHLAAQVWLNRLNEPERAAESYRRALEADPNHLPTVQALGKLYARLQDWEKLIEINSLEAELVTDQKRMVALLYKNGEICEKELGDRERALKFYQQALTIQPDYLPALRAVGNLYLKEGKWEELIRMYRQELRITKEPAQREQLLYRIGAVYEEELNDLEAAEGYYEQILDEHPGSLMALHALERIHRKSGNTEKLVEIYTRIAEHSEDTDTKLYYLFKVAEIYEEMGLSPMAERTYKRMLEIRPGYQPASRALKRIYIMEDRAEETLPLIEAELEQAKSTAEKIELLAELAELYQLMPDKEQETIRVYEEILELDPENMLALRELERLYEKNDMFAKLRPIYERRIELARDKETRIAYMWLLADLKQHLFKDEDLTTDYEAILRENPTDSRALDRLIATYISRGEWDKVIDVYGRAAEHSTNDEERVFFLMQQGQVYEMQLERYDDAEKVYKRVLEIKPKHLPALSALKRCYARTENWEAMKEVLERELEAIVSDQKRVATYYQLAFLHETKLNNPELAIEFYKRTIDIKRSHKEAFERLKALLEERNEWEELLRLYTKRLPTLETDKDAANLHFEMGLLCEEKLKDLSKAITHYQAAVDKDPTHKDALWRLAQILLATEQWSEAEAVLNKLAGVVEDRDELIALYKAQALLYEEHLHDLPRAIAALEDLLTVDEEDWDAREKLAALYAATDRVEDAIAQLRILLNQKDRLPKEKLIEYNLTVAHLYSERLKNDDRAEKYLEEALKLDPSNETTLEDLARIFGKRGKWGKLVELYRHQLETIPDENRDAKAKVLLGLGSVYEELKDFAAAEEMLREAVAVAPENREIRRRLARLLAAQPHKLADAIEVYRKLIEDDPFDTEPYHALFRIYTEKDDRDAAFCTAAVLHYFKAANEQERKLYESLSSAEIVETGLFNREILNRLLMHPLEKNSAAEILHLVAPAIYKLEPPNLDKYDLDSMEKLGATHALSQLVESLGFHLGVERCTIYVSRSQPELFAIEPTKPPTLLLGSALAFAHDKLKRFFVGVSISRMSRGHLLHLTHKPSDLQRYVDAVANQYITGLPLNGYDIKELDSLGRSLVRALSRAQRRGLEPLARQYATERDKLNFNDIVFGMYSTDYRMGLIVCGDISVSFKAWHILNGIEYHEPTDEEEARRFFGDIRQLRDLLLFATSKEYLRLRKEAKIAF